MNKQKNEQKEEKHNWKDDFVHHWKYYLAPSRISLSEKEFIRRKIQEKIENYGKKEKYRKTERYGKKEKNDSDNKHLVKILVMGATPEYRQLCGEIGVPVTMLDFSRYNYEYLGQEVKNKPKEKFIEGNWLTTAPTPNEKYDIILADNTINVVMKKDQIKLYNNVCKMLKDDGFFMPRTFVHEKEERWSSEKVIEEYRKEANGKPLYTWTFRPFVMAVYDYNKEFCVFKDIWKEIKKLYEKGIISSKELEEFSNWSMEFREFKVYVPEREELDKMLKEFFKIKETFFGTEPYLKNMLPFHVLVKK